MNKFEDDVDVEYHIIFIMNNFSSIKLCNNGTVVNGMSIIFFFNINPSFSNYLSIYQSKCNSFPLGVIYSLFFYGLHRIEGHRIHFARNSPSFFHYSIVEITIKYTYIKYE